MIDLNKIKVLFSEFGPAEVSIVNIKGIVDPVLRIRFYDPEGNKREILIGEKNYKNSEYKLYSGETANWEDSIYKNTWSRIIQQGYTNLATIIE